MKPRVFARKAFTLLNKKGLMKWMPDRMHMRLRWYLHFGTRLELDNPQGFNEKLNWLKLHDRKPLYTTMVDKYGAKKYVAERIGEEYIIPTYGVWERFDDIDFDSLPEQFVLKCTHDSGGLVICRDKSTFDMDKARRKINASLKRDFYATVREWPYKDVPRRIIAEKYMEDERNGRSLVDYKFYCFGGEPQFLYISQGLEDHKTARISFVTLDWAFAPYQRSDYAPFTELPEKPEHFEEMVSLCRKLAAGHSFLRVDLYQINGRVYFSELTFYPCGGLMPFGTPEQNLQMGSLLHLPEPTE